ncbi:hypothetical protein HAX54_023245, partial [Datura stramonium]|nr:hypothetical protein [Datura stramonium]
VACGLAPPNCPAECEAHGKTSLPLRLVPRKDRHHTPNALEVEKVGYDTISKSLSYPTHQSSDGLLDASGYAGIASGSQGVGWLVDGGAMSAATFLKYPLRF